MPSSFPDDPNGNEPKEQPKEQPKPVQPKKGGCWYFFYFIIGCCSNIL